MTYALKRPSTRVLFALGIALALVVAALAVVARQKHDTRAPGHDVETPIDVASVIGGCQELDDCSRQCQENKPGSCVFAGRLLEFGHGIAADPARAFSLYERACNLNYGGGCYNAAVLLEAGKGVVKDLARARKLYEMVCQMGSNTSCERARALGDGTSP